MTYLHTALCAFYVLIPIAVLSAVAHRSRRVRSWKPVRRFLLGCISGAVIGGFVAFQYGRAVGGHVPLTQVLLAAYFCIAMILVLKGVNWALDLGVTRLFRVRPSVAPRLQWGRIAGAAATRAVLLLCVGLPYVMALVLLYRPRALADDPKQVLGFGFERVSFQASDGTHLDAFWIPALARRGNAGRSESLWGTRTVLLCHGLASNKSNQLIMAQDLVPNGYNVLAFDFRAHGGSGGQLTTFGDLERRDVLGAVRWVRTVHPKQSQRLFGVGASMGAAALIAAAADPGADGQAIEAIAAYGTYDSLGGLADSVTRNFFPAPLRWLTMNIGLPIASFHTGRNLAQFSPAREVQQLWPRPILVIHGKNDFIIDFDHGQRLYDAALQPKLHLWIDKGDHNHIVADPKVARSVRQFFDTAESML